MADRNFSTQLALDKNVVQLAGTCTIATGTGGVTANNILGATVARTGTGAFTITLADRYPEILSVNLQVGKATAQDLVPQVVAVDLSARTITFRLLTGTTPTDITTEAATLFVDIKMKNSTIAP
jgi:hypothetical protein